MTDPVPMTANLTPEALRALADRHDKARPGRDIYKPDVLELTQALRAIADRDASLAARGFAEGVEAAAKACDGIMHDLQLGVQGTAPFSQEWTAIQHAGKCVGMAARQIRSLTPPAGCEHKDALETEAAANIMDLMMGGNRSWRTRVSVVDELGSTFLDSADWQQALAYARAALAASPRSGQQDGGGR